MVILMVITHASLLFQVFYFISDVAFLEFTHTPAFYQIIKDIGVLFFFSIYYLDIMNKVILGY